MEAIEGKDVILEFFSPNSGDWEPWVCAEDCSIHFTGELVPAKTKGDGPWNRYLMVSKGYEVSCSGLMPYNINTGVTTWDMYGYYDQMTEVPFRMLFNDKATNLLKAILGFLWVTEIDISAPIDWATASLSFTGNGKVSVQDNLLSCQATIGNFQVNTQNEFAVIFGYSGVTDSLRLDYSINGSARDSKFITSDSGSFSIPKILIGPDGNYTITVFPVCESGDDGEPFILNFTVT